MKTCIRLHEIKELDDAHLMPIVRAAFDEDEEPEDCEEEMTTAGRENVYDRHIPDCFTDCRPLAGQTSYVYSIDFKLVKECEDPTKHFFPFSIDTKLAILTSRRIPALCPFPLFTRAGEFQVEIAGTDAPVLDENQLDLMRKFHKFIWQEAIYLRKTQFEFDPESAKLQFLVVPLDRKTDTVDFDFAQRIVSSPAIEWEKRPDKVFQFDAKTYQDAVVIPWYVYGLHFFLKFKCLNICLIFRYQPLGTINTFYVDEVSTDLTSLSPFPEKHFANFADYFRVGHQSNNIQWIYNWSRKCIS